MRASPGSPLPTPWWAEDHRRRARSVLSGGELEDVVQQGVDAVGEVEAGAAGGGGDAGGVGAMVAGGLLRLGLVGGLAGGCFVQGEVFEHGGPAGLDGVAGGVEDLEAGRVGAGALGGRGRGEGAFVDHEGGAAAEQGGAVGGGGAGGGPRSAGGRGAGGRG